MDRRTKRALWNAAQTIASLKRGESITREELIERLRRPLPESTPSEAVVRNGYRHYVICGGIRNAARVVPYGLAAHLARTTVEAVRQAAYRGDLVKLTVLWNGRERVGVTLESLAAWRRWPQKRFEDAVREMTDSRTSREHGMGTPLRNAMDERQDMTICCADIGSVAKGNFGWAGLSCGPDREESSGSDIAELAAFVARSLAAKEKVSLGLECPLWVPVADEPSELTRARTGERNRAWSAAAGSASLATGLAEVAWLLHRIRRQARNSRAFLDWSRFQRSQSGLFIWEAFVSGGRKAGSHQADAMAAVDAFRRALPDPVRKNAVKSAAPTRSLIGGALVWAGWSTDIRLLQTPSLVIRA